MSAVEGYRNPFNDFLQKSSAKAAVIASSQPVNSAADLKLKKEAQDKQVRDAADLKARKEREERKKRELEKLEWAAAKRLESSRRETRVQSPVPERSRSIGGLAKDKVARPSLTREEKRRQALFSPSPPPRSSPKPTKERSAPRESQLQKGVQKLLGKSRHRRESPMPSAMSAATVEKNRARQVHVDERSTTSRSLSALSAKDRLKASFDPTHVIPLNMIKRDRRTIEEVEIDMRARRLGAQVPANQVASIRSTSDFFSRTSTPTLAVADERPEKRQRLMDDRPRASLPAATFVSRPEVSGSANRRESPEPPKREKQRRVEASRKRKADDSDDLDDYESDTPRSARYQAADDKVRGYVRKLMRGQRGDYQSSDSGAESDESTHGQRRGNFAQFLDEQDEADRLAHAEEVAEVRAEKARRAAKAAARKAATQH